MRDIIKMKDFYFNFINKFKSDKLNYVNALARHKVKEKELYDKIINRANKYKDLYGINIYDYDEINNRDLDSDHSPLKERVVQLVNLNIYDELQPLVDLVHYVKVIRDINFGEFKYKAISKLSKMTYNEYRNIVNNYYLNVEKLLIEGKGYRLGAGLGILSIDYCEYKPDMKKKLAPDWGKTKKRKQELILAGKKLYNDAEAKKCKELGIPYDGEKYLVYPDKPWFYNFDLDRTSTQIGKVIFKSRFYIDDKYNKGGSSYFDLAERCNSYEDVMNLNVCSYIKIIILRMKGYISGSVHKRNEESGRYDGKTYYSRRID